MVNLRLAVRRHLQKNERGSPNYHPRKLCPSLRIFVASSWFTDSRKEDIVSFKMVLCLWKSKLRLQELFENLLQIVDSESIQSGLQIIVNCQESPQNNFRLIRESLIIIENHRESPHNNFRLIHKSPRIIPKMFSDWFGNHQESLRITKNHPQNNFRLICESLRITENHPKMFSEWFVNHQESSWITKNHPKNFRLIIKNHWESS